MPPKSNNPLTPKKITEWSDAINKGALFDDQLQELLKHLEIDCMGTPVASVKKSISLGAEDVNHSVTAGVFTHDEKTIIHVDAILSQNPGAVFNLNQFDSFLVALRSQQSTATCIQMPLHISAFNRNHYVQLQIYKDRENNICACIIDSSPNPFGNPAELVQKQLQNNKMQIGAILDIPEAQRNTTQIKVSTVRTKKQLGDKKCGVYVAAGMRALTRAILEKQDGFLSSEEIERIVSNAHHLVDKMTAEGALRLLTDSTARKTEGVTGSTARQNDSAPHKNDEVSAAPPIPDAASAPAADDGTQTPTKQTPADSSGYAHIMHMINEVKNKPQFVNAVSTALDNYIKSFKGAFSDQFFKKFFSDAGLNWARDAKARLDGLEKFLNDSRGAAEVSAAPAGTETFSSENRNISIARQIALEILFLGLKDDRGDILTVEKNSRVDFLLSELSKHSNGSALITLPKQNEDKSFQTSGLTVAAGNQAGAAPAAASS